MDHPKEGSASVYDYTDRSIQQAGYAAIVYAVVSMVSTGLAWFQAPTTPWVAITIVAVIIGLFFRRPGLRHLQEEQSMRRDPAGAGCRVSTLHVVRHAVGFRKFAFRYCDRLSFTRRAPDFSGSRRAADRSCESVEKQRPRSAAGS